ncbi:3-coathanger stack domain-containing protein [Spirosoma jeollabukense]
MEQARLLTSGYQAQPLEEAAEILTASNKVNASAMSVEYKAGQAVVLQPGFEVRAGSVFTAHTGVVSGTIDGKQLMLVVYPNPLESVTTISYILTRAGGTSLHIWNAEVQLLSKLVDNQYQEAGQYQVEWKGEHFPAGASLYKLEHPLATM